MATKVNRTAIDAVIRRNIRQFKKKGVYTVRPGYKFTGGWITDKPAIVVTVDKKLDGLPLREQLPSEVEDVPVDVREATGLQRLRAKSPVQHALVAEYGRAEFHEPHWPEERDVTTGKKFSTAATVRHPALSAQSQKPQIQYIPAKPALVPVTGTMTIIAHASPDAGWPVLQDFFSQIKSHLTVGMYDFTSGHILKALESALAKSNADLELVLDHPPRNPGADQTDDQTMKDLGQQLSARGQLSWALTRNDPVVKAWIFPTAYHIKVAVRDGTTFWLSSGNWNNSNQPELTSSPLTDTTLANSDRDWHAVVVNPELSALFEAYLKHDREVAAENQGSGDTVIHQALRTAMQAHQAEQKQSTLTRIRPTQPTQLFQAKTFTNVPVTIHPILTPDKGVYVGKILQLLQSAQRRIYMQTQYIHPSDQPGDEDFTALITTLRDQHHAGLDVRLITSQYENTAQWMEKLKEYDLDKVLRIQNRVHNKGIVVDSKIVALGSQNWSGDGTLRNRDATLIIEHEAIAQYYEQIFLHDWTALAGTKVVDASHAVPEPSRATPAKRRVGLNRKRRAGKRQ